MATVRELKLHYQKDFERKVFTPDWIVEGIAQRKGLTIVFGEPGCGKTWIMVDMAVAVASGESHWLGLNVTQSTVLVLDEESGLARFSGRVYVTMRGHDSPDEIPIISTDRECINLRIPTDIIAVRNAIKNSGADLVIIDTLANVTPGSDENSSKDMLPSMLALRNLAKEFNCAIIVIHHSNKSGGYRGSSSLKGMCDSMLKIERSEDKETITLESEKGRDGAEQNVSALMNWGDAIFNLSGVDFVKPPSKTDVLEKRILEVLSAAEMNVAQIKDALGVNKNRLSNALKEMADEGKLTCRNGERNAKYYSIKAKAHIGDEEW